jgi:hypothetical protein
MIDNAAVLSPLPIEDAPLFGAFEGLRACDTVLSIASADGQTLLLLESNKERA